LHIPVHDFAMMMTIALRFIPTLIEETDKIMNAQRARGADFANGSLVKRAKALVPVLIPLFVSAFKRAEDLAVAMECRCYRGGKGRTKLHKLQYHWRDGIAMLLMCAFLAGVFVVNYYNPLGIGM
jgi:energy-coupling factor transport system permease protein